MVYQFLAKYVQRNMNKTIRFSSKRCRLNVIGKRHFSKYYKSLTPFKRYNLGTGKRTFFNHQKRTFAEYSISVKNESGQDIQVGLFQNPPPQFINGLSTVWLAKGIQNGGTNTFMWDITWGLAWGTSAAPIGTGVGFVNMSPIINCTPGPSGNPNGANIEYNSTINVWNITGSQNSSVGDGMLGLTTGNWDANISQRENFNILVTMYGSTVACMPGNPNQNVNISLHPTYYLATVRYQQGTIVDLTSLGDKAEVDFTGTTSRSYTLNSNLQFIPN